MVPAESKTDRNSPLCPKTSPVRAGWVDLRVVAVGGGVLLRRHAA